MIADLVIKPSTKVMMMGQPEEVIAKADAEQLAAPEVQVRWGLHIDAAGAAWDVVGVSLHLGTYIILQKQRPLATFNAAVRVEGHVAALKAE